MLAELVNAPRQVMEIYDNINDRWGYWKTTFFLIVNSHDECKEPLGMLKCGERILSRLVDIISSFAQHFSCIPSPTPTSSADTTLLYRPLPSFRG